MTTEQIVIARFESDNSCVNPLKVDGLKQKHQITVDEFPSDLLRFKTPYSISNFVGETELIASKFRDDTKQYVKGLLILSRLTFLAFIGILISTQTGMEYIPITILTLLSILTLLINSKFEACVEDTKSSLKELCEKMILDDDGVFYELDNLRKYEGQKYRFEILLDVTMSNLDEGDIENNQPEISVENSGEKKDFDVDDVESGLDNQESQKKIEEENRSTFSQRNESEQTNDILTTMVQPSYTNKNADSPASINNIAKKKKGKKCRQCGDIAETKRIKFCANCGRKL